MSSIYSVIQQFLKESDWKGIEDADNGTIGLNYTGKNGKWSVIARAREAQQQAVFYSIAPLQIAPEHRPAVSEFIQRINFGTIIGNFEFDLDDGEIRYKSSIDVTNGELTTGLIKSLVIANLASMDKYLPAIQGVINGTAPAEAVKLAEKA